MADIRRFFPFTRWRRPTADSLRRDAWAGFSVGLVLIPQAIAYATLAGMPPETGLYAALIPGIIGTLWGSSALLATGPVALTSLLVAGSLYPLAQAGSVQWVELAIWLSLYAGVIQFLLGAFSMGRVVNLVSQPVVTGFINAAAIIIIVSQLPALLGIPDPFGGGAAGLAARAPEILSSLSPMSLVGIAALAFLVLMKRYAPRFPALLLATVLGIGISWLIDYESLGGQVVGNVPAGLPSLSLLPGLDFGMHRDLLPAALIIALVSFTEAMSSCRILARRRRSRWDENQELIGQGLAKLGGAFCGAFPVSGSFSRSALNLYTGAVSGWSSMFAAACVLFCLLFLTDLIYYLPRPLLAAMIIVPVFSLIRLSAFRVLFSLSRDDGIVAIVTFSVTLLATPGIYWGVFAGVGVSMAAYLYRHVTPRIVEVSLHEDGALRDRRRFDLPPLADDVCAVRIDASLNFLTAPALEKFVSDRCAEDRSMRRLLLCFGAVNDLDASGVDVLESLQMLLRDLGIELYLCSIKKQIFDVLDRTSMLDRLGADHVFATDRDAVSALGGPPRA